MDPVSANWLSNKCGEVVSSNCIGWAGGPIDGICGTDLTLTQVISQINENNNCCQGTFPAGHQSCYTGIWTDMSSSIATSGTIGSISYNIPGFGRGFFVSSAYNRPSYKWTRDGSILLRGSFQIDITTTSQQVAVNIPLFSFSNTCFPTGFTGADTVSIGAAFDSASSQSILKGIGLYLTLDYPSGILYLSLQFVDIGLGSFSLFPDLTTQFNIA